MLAGLNYVHSKGVIHRDLKPENLMFKRCDDGRLLLKMIDFGLATNDADDDQLQSAAGTHYYLAPEIITNVYNRKVDIWSAGMILLFLINKQLPLRSTSQRQLLQEILAFQISRVKFKSGTSQSLKQLASKLLQKDFNNRPDAREVLESGLLQQSHNNSI